MTWHEGAAFNDSTAYEWGKYIGGRYPGLSHFRKRSPEIQYSAQFNEFLTKLKTVLSEDSEAWKTVKTVDISFLSSAEDPSVDVSPAEARAFLHGEEEVDVNLAAASLNSICDATFGNH
ncbi:hypothetical protein AM587_10005696 [Phytophthora nicotianae]|uniref:Ku C-terminal domain-containing protein n=1 Tax=Phytophthora nicotianae TaxID=4792 RepID=A0A0W8DVL1_PHYNI|nr:hypothetical protein AM587_10005696 [Phytophthora nicotianae]